MVNCQSRWQVTSCGLIVSGLLFSYAPLALSQTQFSIPIQPTYQPVQPSPQQQKQLAELLRQAKQSIDQRNFNQAIALYQQATTYAPDNAELFGSIGYLHSRQAQFPQAITAFQQALALDPNNPEYYDGLGYSFGQSGQLSEATSAYSTAITLAPREVKYRLALGIIYLRQGDYARVRQTFDELSRLDPGNADATVMMGAALLQSGQLEQTVNFTQKALQYHPDRSELYLQLGTAYYELENYAAARQVLEPRLRREWDSLSLHLLWANVLEAERNYPAALEAYKKARRIDRQAIVPQIGVGRMYLTVDQPSEAIWIFRDLTTQNPSNGDFYYFLGEAYVVDGKTNLAKTAFEKAQKLYQAAQNAEGSQRVSERLQEL